MTQATSMVIAPGSSGTDQRTQINDMVEDINSGHAGASRPAYLDASHEGMWVKEVSGTVREIYYWDKAQDILLWTIDMSANTATPTGAAIQFGKLYANKTGAFTAVNGDNGSLFTCNATSASFTAALDTTSSLATGWFAIFQKTDATANTVTIDPDSTNTVNGATTLVLNRQFDTAIVIKIGATSFSGLLLAPLDSAALTGTPTTPTPSAGDSSTKIASTAFVANSYAPLASPALSGTPTAPTQSAGNNSTRIATTAFVQQEITASLPSGLIKAIRRQFFGSSGTYTPHAAMAYAFMRVRGAGGGGGGGVGGNRPGAGGGQGGYAEYLATAADVGASKAVTVGTGGTAGACNATNPTAGGTGGASSVGTLVAANGGLGGQPGGGSNVTTNAGQGGPGGAPTAGDFGITGQNGNYSINLSGFVVLGAGGGEGAGAGVVVASVPTTAGTAGTRGGGGSGSSSATAGSTGAGAGGNGWVDIIEYCTA